MSGGVAGWCVGTACALPEGSHPLLAVLGVYHTREARFMRRQYRRDIAFHTLYNLEIGLSASSIAQYPAIVVGDRVRDVRLNTWKV